MLHFAVPAAPFNLELLATVEERMPDGSRICEAGCYQCLLSYFNQPDHDNINRQDKDALTLLVALANGHVQAIDPLPLQSGIPESTTDSLTLWLNMLHTYGLHKPDATAVAINNGAVTADALYRQARTLIFFVEPAEEVHLYTKERGYQLLVFPEDVSTWPTIFAEYPDIFGGKG